MKRVWITSEVFGLGARIDGPSYVNRGDLDERLSYLLSANRHIVIHGDSKQGKSWLRERLMPEERTLFVQCLSSHTAQSLIQDALGQLNVRMVTKATSGTTFSGELDLSMAAEFGVAVITKARAEGKLRQKNDQSDGAEFAPVGRTPADIGWVAFVLRESGKRLVLEDFHYLSEEVQREVSFLLKALLGYRVPLVVVGVWAQDNYFTYFNGDLTGRIDDVFLRWTNAELRSVLRQGSEALNIEFSAEIEAKIIEASVGNVGTLQRIAETLCLKVGVYETQAEKKLVQAAPVVQEVFEEIAASMGGRYAAFSYRFIQGIRRAPQGRASYEALLRSIVESPEGKVVAGLTVDDILTVAIGHSIDVGKPAIQAAMRRIIALQAKMEIRPIVLSFDHNTERLVLVDRSLLFFRRHQSGLWPWHMDDEEGDDFELEDRPSELGSEGDTR